MIVSIDFETYYSVEYSLLRMREIDYILDPRFEIIMCAVQEGDGPNECFVGHANVAARLARIDWSQAALLCQNTRFDGAILFWHFGHLPALYMDTMAMARALLGPVTGKVSLKRIAAYLGLPPKGDDAHKNRGRTLASFSHAELRTYADYCLHDNYLCRTIFDRLRPVFPKSELAIIDWVVRLYVQPQVFLDPGVLAEHLGYVQAERDACFARVAHIDQKDLRSNDKFATLLESHGVDVPLKVSPTTGMLIPAFSRNDKAFKELCEDETQTPMVQALLAARVQSKSTIEITRTQAMLNLSLKGWHDGSNGWMPVPIRFYGAHTGRMSGDGGFNFQNLKRGSRIRAAIQAPAGYRIIHRDASQIEARMVAFLAGCRTLLRAFANREDVYCKFASVVYGRLITALDKLERFVGKTSILGLGYGMAHERFQHTLLMGTPSVRMELPECMTVVQTYRMTYSEIVHLWSRMRGILNVMLAESGGGGSVRYGNAVDAKLPDCLTRTSDAIFLPNGMPIAYPDLRTTMTINATGSPQPEISYLNPFTQGRVRIYGAKMVENITQALARIVITDTALRVRHETGLWPFMTTHDSLDYCVPERDVEHWDAYLERQFAIPPSWAPTLPLASEGGWGLTLAQAESRVNN